jgi:hypothetical protein
MLVGVTAFVRGHGNRCQGFAFEFIPCQAHRTLIWRVVIALIGYFDLDFLQVVSVQQVSRELTAGTGKVFFVMLIMPIQYHSNPQLRTVDDDKQEQYDNDVNHSG